jgi:RNase_H superfamily
MSNASEPKILFLDIETFPHIAYVWGKYDQNVIKFKQETCIATFAAKWLKGPLVGKSLYEYSGYSPNSYDDKKLVKDLWNLLDEADIVIAHNGADFDVKVCRARFLFHGMRPPSPFKIVDTKLVARKVARFSSNKLDDLASYLGFGSKIKTDFDLWLGCITGDKSSWERMLKYNKHDILLLEKLYNRLLPWAGSHPNMTLYKDRSKCPKCGSGNINYRGLATLVTGQYKKFQCQDCGGWGRDTKRANATTRVNAQTD